MGRPARIEKRKWDGTVSTVETAVLLEGVDGAVVWFVREGTLRDRPTRGVVEVVARDEIWATVPGGWWVLCGAAPSGGALGEYELHAAAAFEPPLGELVTWIDLDLDLTLHGDEVDLEDEGVFHHHAETMGYPPEVVQGAWEGISELAPRYTTQEWPFDGWMGRRLQEARAQEHGHENRDGFDRDP